MKFTLVIFRLCAFIMELFSSILVFGSGAIAEFAVSEAKSVPHYHVNSLFAPWQ